MLKERATGAFLGMALGESLAWTSLYHRSYLMPPWTRRLRREIDSRAEGDGLLQIALPFTLNQPTEAFSLGPADKVEWACFQAQVLAESGGRYCRDLAVAAWLRLTHQKEKLRFGLSQRAALENLTRGKGPPVSGNDNPHYFDDSACFRAIPIGVAYAGRSVEAGETAYYDAAISNAYEGVWAAQAVAGAIAVACAGGDVTSAVETAAGYLPKGTWIDDLTRRALDSICKAKSLVELVFRLNQEIVDVIYSYGNSAAQTVALSLAISRFVAGDLERGVFAALSLARSAESVPALVGALCGALTGPVGLSGFVIDRISTLRGIALPTLAGLDVRTIVDQLCSSISCT